MEYSVSYISELSPQDHKILVVINNVEIKIFNLKQAKPQIVRKEDFEYNDQLLLAWLRAESFAAIHTPAVCIHS